MRTIPFTVFVFWLDTKWLCCGDGAVVRDVLFGETVGLFLVNVYSVRWLCRRTPVEPVPFISEQQWRTNKSKSLVV